jgi:acetyl esterase/lipase
MALIRKLAMATSLMLAQACSAAEPAVPPTSAPPAEVVPLWPQGAPATIANPSPESVEVRKPYGEIVRNVSQPSLSVYPADPARTNGAAVIVAPGGGFHMLSWVNEGTDVARWLNGLGFTVFVLKYRLTPTGDDFQRQLLGMLISPSRMQEVVASVRPAATADGEQAVRLVRRDAARWGVSPQRIGMMGFSAGGAVSVWTMLQGKAESRPDFAMAIYPGALPEAVDPPAGAPPLFVLAAEDDRLAADGSRKLAAAWKAAGAPVAMKLYPKGGHGFGMAKTGAETDGWTGEAEAWLKAQGVLR